MDSAKADADGNLADAQAVLDSLQAAERQRLAELQAQQQRDSQAAAQQAQQAIAASSSSSGGGDSSGGGGDGDSSAGGGYSGGGRAAAAVQYALSQVGKRYVAAADGPDSFDCSGLTMMGYKQIGLNLPHYSGAQIAFGTAIDWTTQPIRPGDLVFLESAAGSGIISHVGIAISATMWIHAPRTGDVVREGNIPMGRVVGVRRLVNG
jgi:cell wall-associated NlpC family hydrolase